MEDDNLAKKTVDLIHKVNQTCGLNAQTIKDNPHIESTIVLLHNRLGNFWQLISSSTHSFNSSDQNLDLASANAVARDISSSLFDIFQLGLISEIVYQAFEARVQDLTAKLNTEMDFE